MTKTFQVLKKRIEANAVDNASLGINNSNASLTAIVPFPKNNTNGY
jgi:hypothetical protein